MKALLVLIQTDGPLALAANRATIAFAQEYTRLQNIPFDVLAPYGTNLQIAYAYAHYGARNAIVTTLAGFNHAHPHLVSSLCASFMEGEEHVALAGPATQWGTETLAGAAGRLDIPMLGSVRAIEQIDGQAAFQVSHGHGATQTVRLETDRAIFSIAPDCFGRPEIVQNSSPEIISAGGRPSETDIIRRKDLPPLRQNDLQTARIVVAGGRALGDAETFDRLIAGLAEKLGGAAAATGAAVQTGIAPSELLIGQTGQSVSPDLYIAAGISGSDQHTAGFRDAKVVVAINSNPNAAIFRMADYGLVADVHQALPELIEKV